MRCPLPPLSSLLSSLDDLNRRVGGNDDLQRLARVLCAIETLIVAYDLTFAEHYRPISSGHTHGD